MTYDIGHSQTLRSEAVAQKSRPFTLDDTFVSMRMIPILLLVPAGQANIVGRRIDTGEGMICLDRGSQMNLVKITAP
jgi:hypothetical protein